MALSSRIMNDKKVNKKNWKVCHEYFFCYQLSKSILHCCVAHLNFLSKIGKASYQKFLQNFMWFYWCLMWFYWSSSLLIVAVMPPPINLYSAMRQQHHQKVSQYCQLLLPILSFLPPVFHLWKD